MIKEKGEELEPHPVSGEVEIHIDWAGRFGEPPAMYQRADIETLRMRITISDLGILAYGTYCPDDTEGSKDGWRISSVRPIPSSQDVDHREGDWWASIPDAEEFYTYCHTKQDDVANKVYEPPSIKTTSASKSEEKEKVGEEEEEEDDDAAYWAQYDNASARATPAAVAPSNPSPAPYNLNKQTAEDAYFAQYSSVQPAMDSHDPDEVVPEGVAPGLDSGLGAEHAKSYKDISPPNMISTDANPIPLIENDGRILIYAPRPHSGSQSSRASSGLRSAIVSNLEEAAEKSSPQGDSPVFVSPPSPESQVSRLSEGSVDRETQAEVAVRQHISASLKSMWRLAKAMGVDQESFKELVEREAALCALNEDA